MSSKLRKFYLFVIALQGTLIGFLIYSKISRPPEMDIIPSVQTADEQTDASPDIRNVGDFGVGKVQNAKYKRLNSDKSIEREFGFRKLLHSRNDEWEIDKPYMNIYRKGFTCNITADRGQIQVDSSFGNPTPKDATLSGNVVIHLIPEGSNGIKESFIYLDDIIYLSEQSRFSTAGPVKVISEDVHILGKGLDLIYNYQLDRLEFFRIIRLDSMRIRSLRKDLLTAESDAFSETAVVPEKSESPPLPANTSVVVDYYNCIFNKNVVIDSPRQLLFADQVSIKNIASEKDRSGRPQTSVSENVTEAAHANDAKAGNDSSDSFVYIFVTCDDGILVTPKDSTRPNELVKTTSVNSSVLKIPQSINENTHRPTLVTQTIDYDMSTRQVSAAGPTELMFYTVKTDQMNKTESSTVKITAREKTTFMPALGRAVFQGDCKSTFSGGPAGSGNKYTLESPKLTVDLQRKTQDSVSSSPDGLEYLTAEGGVTINVTPANSEKVLAVFRADTVTYNSRSTDILAQGPSQLEFFTDNLSLASDPDLTLPVKITSKKKVSFLLSKNQAVFEDDCICTITDAAKNFTLSSSKLIVDLSEGQKVPSGSIGQISHLSAQGRATVTVTQNGQSTPSAVFAGQTIDYDALSQDIVTDGPSVLILYRFADIAESTNSKQEVPIEITSQRRFRFLPAQNRAVFEGDCICSARNTDRKYQLTAPTLTVDLSDRQNGKNSLARGIEYVLAEGGVNLEITRTGTIEKEVVFSAPQIEYSAVADEVVARGHSRLNFYANDLTEESSSRVPVEITAEELCRFISPENRVIFRGNCRAVMNTLDAKIQKKYVLTAPNLTVDLAASVTGLFNSAAANIKHLTADGGMTQLTAERYAEKLRLGFVKLKGFSLEFNAVDRIFNAAGPGIMIMDNTNSAPDTLLSKNDSQQQLLCLAAPDKIQRRVTEDIDTAEQAGFSLRRRCYAFIQNFDTLKYFFNTNRVMADGNKRSILISYVPVVRGSYGDKVEVTCDRVAADIAADQGRTELIRLLATGAVTYSDSDNHFVGGKLFYSAENSYIKANGDETQSCLLNGTLVNGIEYDLRTGKINAKISGPGALHVTP